MREFTPNPMDRFPVRPLQFRLNAVEPTDVIWSRTCPEFALFLNAFALHVPHFERYLIRAMRAARDVIADENLRRDITAIIGQEAHHARNFLQFNEVLAKRYPKVAAIDAAAREHFVRHADTDALKRLVGYTAGYETFTFLAGMVILQNHDRWFADADPTLKAMWVWHQVEEVEHGAVAFEVYKHLYGQHEWYRKWMVLVALLHIAGECAKTYVHMARVEGWLRNPFKAVSTLGFCASMFRRLIVASLPVFRRNYHPRHHPFVTHRQNPIQMAWRRYEAQGGDVLALDHEKMAAMMRLNV